jgi:hypothetical protein
MRRVISRGAAWFKIQPRDASRTSAVAVGGSSSVLDEGRSQVNYAATQAF